MLLLTFSRKNFFFFDFLAKSSLPFVLITGIVIVSLNSFHPSSNPFEQESIKTES